MGIRFSINRIFGVQPAAAPEPDIASAPDPRGAPGSRVHHEIMMGEQVGGRFPWLCRVYAQNGAVTEKEGVADTEQAAKNAALSWAAITKAGLRGEA